MNNGNMRGKMLYIIYPLGDYAVLAVLSLKTINQ